MGPDTSHEEMEARQKRKWELEQEEKKRSREERERNAVLVKPLTNRGLLRARRTVSRAWDAVGGEEWWVSQESSRHPYYNNPGEDRRMFTAYCPKLPVIDE